MRTLTILACALMILAGPATARDSKYMIDIAEVMQSDDYKEKLDSDIRLYFGDQKHSAIKKKKGEYVTNKKTKAFKRSDNEACSWVLLSALITLQERARSEGGNAVVNIRSYYKKKEFSSTTEIECHAGNIIAGVALIADVVKL